MSKVDKYIDLYNDACKNVTKIWPEQRRNGSSLPEVCSVYELFKGLDVRNIERVNATIGDRVQCRSENTENNLTIEEVCTTMAYSIAVSGVARLSEFLIICDVGPPTEVTNHYDDPVLHPFNQPTIYNTPWLLFAYIQYAKRSVCFITDLNLSGCSIRRYYESSKTTSLINSTITLTVDGTKHDIKRFKELGKKYISSSKAHNEKIFNEIGKKYISNGEVYDAIA